MQQTIESLASNPFVTLGSLALAILGILLAFVFYFRSQKNKTPCFEEVSTTIIEGLHKSLDGLEVHYKGTVQKRITVTKVAFWNDGKETIDASDMVSKDPLRIEVPKTIDILDIQVIDVSSSSNSVNLGQVNEIDDYVMYPVDFEYLDRDEYFVIQIIHNGASDEKLEIKGKIKGVKSIERVTGARAPSVLMKLMPFSEPFELLLNSPLFMRYFGTITYFSIGLVATWSLVNGNTSWYVWVGGGFCFMAAGIMYYGFRHIAPVKI